MTAFDQAFVKAYSQQRQDSHQALPSGVHAIPLSVALPMTPPEQPGDCPNFRGHHACMVDENGTVPLGGTPSEQPEEVAAAAATSLPSEPVALSPGEPMSKSEAKSLLERLVQAPVEALPGLLSGYHAEPTVEHAAEPALQTAVEPAHAAADSALLPALEVDHLLWPGVCDRLDAAAGADLDRLADNLAAEISPQHNLVAVAASRRGEGATTVLLCTAARLAQKGLKVVLVDADLEGARLGRRLGLTPDAGWERVLAGRLPLAEALITSSRQRLTVLPLADPLLATDAVRSRAVANLQTLRKAFDVVLVKLGPLDDPHSQGVQLACGLCDDLRLLLVCDNRAIGPASRSEICAVLTAGGVAEIFLAENFV